MVNSDGKQLLTYRAAAQKGCVLIQGLDCPKNVPNKSESSNDLEARLSQIRLGNPVIFPRELSTIAQ